jgi:transposase
MAPTTRSMSRQTPPPAISRPGDYDTVKKLRFFNAYDTRGPTDSLRSIAREYAPSLSTAHRWLKKRNELGSPAYRRTRKLSVRLGRRPAVSKEQCQILVSPSKNPVRDQLYEAQIEYYNLHVHPRTIQRRLRKTTNNAQRYKQAYIQKNISKKNRALRV